jgi:hypothetical protein
MTFWPRSKKSAETTPQVAEDAPPALFEGDAIVPNADGSVTQTQEGLVVSVPLAEPCRKCAGAGCMICDNPAVVE